MFIFRALTPLFAILGYILAVVALYLGFFPLHYSAQERVSLTNLLDCSTQNSSYTLKNLTDEEITNIKSDLGPTAPIELIRDFMKSIESVSDSVGTETVLSIESCDTEGKSSDILGKVNKSFEGKSKFYEYGLFSDFVKSVNELPFAKLSNVELKVDSTFARSNVCNTPINREQLYFISVVDTQNEDTKKAIVFNINLQQSADSSLPQDVMGNLIVSGHYLKASLKCNG
jgi:hypothetical protein